jgi:hypothetical protein
MPARRAGGYVLYPGKGQMNRCTGGLALALVALACTASPAFADDDYSTEAVSPSWTAASAESCADPDVAPVLTSFKDDGLYAPAPGGAFEDGAAGWELAGGAAVAPATDGLSILGTSAGALNLPVGASATSPTFCVDERFPFFRFTFAQQAADADANVRVEVIYPGLAKDNVRKAKDLSARRGRGWQLTDRIKLDPLHGLKRGGWRLVALRLTVKDGKPGALVRVDDVLVDPRARL